MNANLQALIREQLGRCKSKFEISEKDPQPVLSYLRQKVTLSSSQTTYDFNFDDNQPGIATDRKLSIKDAFYGVALGIFLNVEATAKPGSGALMTYPNLTVLNTDAGITTSAGSELETLYNGRVKISIDQTTIAEAIPTRAFRYVPQTQQSPICDTDQLEYPNGFVMLTPEIAFRGNKKNNVQLIMPYSPNLGALTAGMEVQVVAEMWGFHIPGGAGLAAKR